MRKLATVQTIKSLDPIEGADKIEKATVLGWEVVVRKGEFSVGDKVIYIEIDSILPEMEYFEFMRDRKFRVKTIKLRGQISQGLIVPMNIIGGKVKPDKAFWEGDDVTEILGIRKYDPQAEFEAKEMEKSKSIAKNKIDRFMKRYKWYRGIWSRPDKLPFPSFIKKTDEDRIQLYPEIHKYYNDAVFEVTEKIDGQSATYFCIKNPKRGLFGKKFIYGVCSRNYHLVKEDNSSYWNISRQLGLKEKMLAYCRKYDTDLIIQGEIIGNKIQGNKYVINGYKFFLFNAFLKNHETGTYHKMMFPGVQMIADVLKLETVPFITRMSIKGVTIPQIVEFARRGSSLADIPAEGVVMRTRYKNDLFSVKVINPDFLIKFEN